MSSKFLDKTGLDTLWAKIKSTFQTQGNLVTSSSSWSSTPSDTKYPSEKLVKDSLDGKQDDLGISSSGDAGKFLNEQGDWAVPAGTEQVNADWNATSGKAEILHKPTLGTAASKNVPTSGDASATQVVMGGDSRLTRSVWSGGGTAVCGYKICTTVQIAGKSGQASNIYAIVMGSMCLTNKYASQPQGSSSSGVDGALAMGSFMIWCEGKPDGTITARARLFSSDAAFNNDDIAICKKYVNGAVEWFVAFGPWDSSKAVTASRSFGMSVCFDYVQNASIPDTLEAVPSGYGYEDYYTLWKHPYLQSTKQGAGSTARPVYITANGEVKECTYAISTSATGTDKNTIYLV